MKLSTKLSTMPQRQRPVHLFGHGHGDAWPASETRSVVLELHD